MKTVPLMKAFEKISFIIGCDVKNYLILVVSEKTDIPFAITRTEVSLAHEPSSALQLMLF